MIDFIEVNVMTDDVAVPLGYEIIPAEVLDGLTPERMDMEANRLVDNQGRVWVDLRPLPADLDVLLDGGRGPVRLCGKRAAS